MQTEIELNELMEGRAELEASMYVDANRVADSDLEKTIRLYKITKQRKEVLEKELALLKDQITISMGEAVTLVSMDGELLATWNWSKPVVRFDTKRFKEELPALYANYSVQSEPVRSFLVK